MKQQIGETATQQRVIENYARTTSGRNGPMTEKRMRRSNAGLARYLRVWLPGAGESVLDLGCGRGELLHLCAGLGIADLTGVNLCQEEIDEARRFVRADFICRDVVDYLEDTSRRFNVIFALNLLEHLSKDALLRFLSGAAARLHSGGALIAMVPNALSPFSSMTRHWDITHEWAFTPNNFRQLAALSGFRPEIQFRECGPVPHGIVSAVRYALWQIIRSAIRAYLLVEVADAKGGVYTMDMLVRLHVAK